MPETEIYSDSFPSFSATCNLVFTGLTADSAKSVLQKIKIELEQLENILSPLSLISDVNKLNQASAGTWVEIDPVLTDVLLLCTDFYAMSNGAFDVCTGPLYNLWEKGMDVDAKELKTVKEKCGFNQLELDPENNRVRFLSNGMKLDLRAIDKAYAIDIMRSLLIENKVSNCIISFDEEVILALGYHPSGEAWPIGVRNLTDQEDFLHVFQSSNLTTVNSGTIVFDNDSGQAIRKLVISPESGLPVEERETVSVTASSASFAAFLAHIWLILPEHDQSIVAEQLSGVEIFEAGYLDDDIKTKLTLFNDEENN